MTEILIRDLPQDISVRLKELAVAHGVSPEEESVRLLRRALESDTGGRHSFVAHLLSEEGKVDELPLPPKTYPSAAKFDVS